MSNFTPLVEREFEFQGDIIKATYSRLKRNDMLKVLPLMKNLNEVQGDVVMVDGMPTFPNADIEKQQAVINDVLTALIDSVPNYIKSFSGLKDADDNDVDIETVTTEFYFLNLAAKIALQMIKDSSATEGNA